MDDADYRNRLRVMGLKVAYYRRLKGLTQEAFAEKMGVSWSLIGKVETGLTGISLRMLLQICAALDVTPNQLLLD